MMTQEQLVLACLVQWLAAGQTGYLCTIVKAVGSSPRPVGSLLACSEQGEHVGSLSGGCIEEDLLEKITADELCPRRVQIIEYGVSAEENERLGLPCGGRLQVLVQRLEPNGEDESWLGEVLAALQRRACVMRRVDLSSGTTRLESVAAFTALAVSGETLWQCFGPRMRMLLVGAGQLSHTLAELALAMDYEVIVTDPRNTMLDRWQGPAVELLGGMPDDAVRRCCTDPHTAVITLTHDPRIDDMALMEALVSSAWYVGALGSRKTTASRKQRLRQLDLDDVQLQRLHAPVGLDIGSKTPMEIAVAIMAELTALRRGGGVPR